MLFRRCVMGRRFEQGEELVVAEASQREPLDARLPVQRRERFRERVIGADVRFPERPDDEEPERASAATTWRRSWTVGRSAQCKSSSTKTTGATAEIRDNTSTTAPNSKYRSDSASLDDESLSVSRVARSGARRPSALPRAPTWAASTSAGACRTTWASTSAHGWYGIPSSSSQRPYNTTVPSSNVARANAAANEVLPIPGSPETNTTRCSPSVTACNDAVRPSRSWARPTNAADDAVPTRAGSGIASSSAAWRGIHTTRDTATRSSKPCSSNAPSGSNSNPPRDPVNARTTSVTRISPPSAVAHRRDASTTGTPK